MIGIMTFHQAANYGAVWQAFALQQTLFEQQHDNEIIDYCCRSVYRMHAPHAFLFAPNIKQMLKLLLRFPMRMHKRKVFNNFLTHQLILSKEKNITKEQMPEKTVQYSRIIFGSDQIWNDSLTENDDTFYGGFTNSNQKCLSYAASFGTTSIALDRKDIVADYLRKFHAITLREKQAGKILEDMGICEYKTVLDPVLLHDRDWWCHFFSSLKYQNYVLIYTLKKVDIDINLIKDFAKSISCQIIWVNDTMVRKSGITYLAAPSPNEWLTLIANARYVITDSFHATAFSINFHTEFGCLLSSRHLATQSRITDLLEETGLSDRLQAPLTNRRIDWECVDKKLLLLRTDSVNQLIKMLRG